MQEILIWNKKFIRCIVKKNLQYRGKNYVYVPTTQ